MKPQAPNSKTQDPRGRIELTFEPADKLAAGVYMVIAASDNGLYRKKIVIQ